jgi:hypothetical protein
MLMMQFKDDQKSVKSNIPTGHSNISNLLVLQNDVLVTVSYQNTDYLRFWKHMEEFLKKKFDSCYKLRHSFLRKINLLNTIKLNHLYIINFCSDVIIFPIPKLNKTTFDD